MQHLTRTFKQGPSEVSLVLYLDTAVLMSPKLDTEPQLGLPVRLLLRLLVSVFFYWVRHRWCGLRSALEHRALRGRLRRTLPADTTAE